MSSAPSDDVAHAVRHSKRPLAMAAAIGVGALTVVQSRINGELGQEIGSGFVAAWLSFLVGLVLVVTVVFVSRKKRGSLKRIFLLTRRDEHGNRAFNPLFLLGGLGGATFVAAQSSTVQYLGVAVFTVSIVAAQNASSLFVDRIGLGPHGVQPVTRLRALAAVIATAGVAVAVAGQSSGNDDFTFTALFFALFAGCVIAIQQAINGRVSQASSSPWVAGLANFTVGWLGLSFVVLLLAAFQGSPTGDFPSFAEEPWLFIGGFIGVAFIVVAAAVVHSLGVLLFALLSIAGQMTGALVLDLVVPEDGHTVTWQLFVGVVVTGGAVALATLARRP